jgi:phosphate transport system permease protein
MSSITRHSEVEAAPSGELAGSTSRRGDRVFAGLSVGSGALVVALIAAVAVFLLARAIPSLADDSATFLTDRVWNPGGNPPRFGIPDLLWVTVISSVVAMVISVPVSVGVALFLTQYAPPRLARPFGAAVDLLAAVPSIVYGLWGAYVVLTHLTTIQNGIGAALGWIPLFSLKQTPIPNSIFAGSVVLSIMILPIVTALSREIFAQTPTAHKEAALALGATRWEVIRTAVLPYGRSGVLSASMLGLGRALGETIAVLFIINNVPTFSWSIFTGGETFASRIARDAGEFDTPQKTGAYIAAGLVLFVLTFAVNAVARIVIERRKAFPE